MDDVFPEVGVGGQGVLLVEGLVVVEVVGAEDQLVVVVDIIGPSTVDLPYLSYRLHLRTALWDRHQLPTVVLLGSEVIFQVT